MKRTVQVTNQLQADIADQHLLLFWEPNKGRPYNLENHIKPGIHMSIFWAKRERGKPSTHRCLGVDSNPSSEAFVFGLPHPEPTGSAKS